jgi:hypothetical protein
MTPFSTSHRHVGAADIVLAFDGARCRCVCGISEVCWRGEGKVDADDGVESCEKAKEC